MILFADDRKLGYIERSVSEFCDSLLGSLAIRVDCDYARSFGHKLSFFGIRQKYVGVRNNCGRVAVYLYTRQLLQGIQEGLVRSVRRVFHADFTGPIRAKI